MSRLDHLVSEARAERPAFDAQGSLVRALAKKEHRARRDRVVRRGIVGLSGAAFLGLLFVRAATASGGVGSTPTVEPAPVRQELATRASDDGGFARD